MEGVASVSSPEKGLVRYSLCRDVIAHRDSEGVVLTNVFTRTHVECNAAGLAFIGSCLVPRSAGELRALIKGHQGNVRFRDRTCFSNLHGLLADPSNLARQASGDEVGAWCGDSGGVFSLLEKRFILISDLAQYLERFSRKRNIFDDRHLGNFHQQLGYELRVKRRLDPDQWWLEQKFTDDLTGLRENLYRWIQLHFWDSFFTESFLRGKRVLDVGCGPGFYSRFLARRGARVLGLDPASLFIEKAIEQNAQEKLEVEYRLGEVGSGAVLEDLPAESFDLVILQDTLLFYFVPYDERGPNDRGKVLGELKRVLKEDGSLFVIEPHGVFWLSPWLGEPKRPFTVMTEYARKGFGVTPSLGQMAEAFREAGFLIRRLMELGPSEQETQQGDPRGVGFATEFPLWWVFELVKDPIGKGGRK